MDNKIHSGGDLIGSGSFGCVFKPAIKCETKKSVSDDTVSKVFFGPNSKYETKTELKLDKMIKRIKGYKDWANIWTNSCLPQKYNEVVNIEPKIADCLNENNISNLTVEDAEILTNAFRQSLSRVMSEN